MVSIPRVTKSLRCCKHPEHFLIAASCFGTLFDGFPCSKNKGGLPLKPAWHFEDRSVFRLAPILASFSFPRSHPVFQMAGKQCIHFCTTSRLKKNWLLGAKRAVRFPKAEGRSVLQPQSSSPTDPRQQQASRKTPLEAGLSKQILLVKTLKNRKLKGTAKPLAHL